MSRTGLSLTFSLLLSTSAAAADNRKELLDLLSTSHSASIQSIRTLSCRVAIADGLETLQTGVTGQYWRSLDLIRVHETVALDGHTEDLQSNGARVLALSTYPNARGDKAFAGRKAVNDHFCTCDVWSCMLLNFPGPKTARLTLDQLLEKASGTPKVTRLINGEMFLDLTYDDPDRGEHRLQIWFDPGVNYLVRKMLMTLKQFPKSEWEFTIHRFSEPNPGVFLPLECIVRWSKEGKLFVKGVKTISDVRLNEPILPRTFDLDIEPGTPMTDKIEGTMYRMGRGGKPMGKVERIVNRTITTLGAVDMDDNTEQTREEPVAWTLWITSASLVLLGIGGCFWLVYRRRSLA